MIDDPGAVDDEASKKHVEFRHDEVKLATGGTGGATVSRKTPRPAQLPVASASRVLGPVTVVPFQGAWCRVPSLVAYQSEPLARNMPLAVVKLTGPPLEGSETVISLALMTPPVTWLATEEALVSGEKARL